MALLSRAIPASRKNDVYMAMVVARREIRDAFRDWRIIIPILFLTLGFPALMNFTAGRLLGFMEQYGAEIIATQLIPFLLLVVGFFPMSFSLIIALETFVGERERKSLEPLLSTPLTDTQLYMGKMTAALVPPLLASYLGMGVYMLGLRFSVGWTPTWQLVAQTVLLTTVQGVIMVAGAVIGSSQTTSVRAANLLASFIIVPMAMLIQGEAAALFWGNHAGLWWLALALAITALTLIRMGVKIFNREALMGQEIDQIRLGLIWGQFWRRYSGRGADGRYPRPLVWYGQTFALLKQLRIPLLILLLATAAAAFVGMDMAQRFQFPAELQSDLTGKRMLKNLASLQGYAAALPAVVFFHNVRVILLQAILGLFTFGVLGVMVFMVPWGVLGFIAGQFALAGQDPSAFLLATVAPHAVIELPALLLVSAAALRWHVTIIAPPSGRTLSEAFLLAMADFGRVFVGIVLPLLLVAAFVEAFITPLVLVRVYGG